jgi:hypothetical protein
VRWGHKKTTTRAFKPVFLPPCKCLWHIFFGKKVNEPANFEDLKTGSPHATSRRGSKKQIRKRPKFFSKKNTHTQKTYVFTPPPPLPPPTFSRALSRAGFVVSCLAVPNGGLWGAQWVGSVRIGLRRPVGLDARIRL